MPAEDFSMSPPRTIPEDDFRDPPTWPKVVGIISICWATFGFLCSSCGVAMFTMSGTLMKGAEQQLGPMPDVMKPNQMQLVSALLGYIPTTILMIGGILTLTRKAAGRTVHLAYAAIGLVLGLFGATVGVLHQLDVDAWVKQNPSEKWAQNHSPAIAWGVIVCILLISFVWPVFCAIWFGPMKKRPEDAAPGPVSI